MIQTFKARNYGCLRDVSIPLTALHAFIGPNDTGKSTILRAIRSVAQLADGTQTLSDPLIPVRVLPRMISQERSLLLAATASRGTFTFSMREGIYYSEWSSDGRRDEGQRLPDSTYTSRGEWYDSIVEEFRGAAFVKLDADALRQPSGLVPEDKQIEFLSHRGAGLPGLYQAISSRGDDALAAILKTVKALFPTIKRIGVPAVSESLLTLEAELNDGTRVRPESMSDGLLLYLGFAALSYLRRFGVLLVDEPETGLHPARIRDVLTVLRNFVEQTQTQVILATHSPLVVNELRPEEVTVVTRHPELGTRTRLLKDTPNFERRAKAAELGELWLSYANGVDEAPLLGNDPAAA